MEIQNKKKKKKKKKKKIPPLTGHEPATPGLEVQCAIHCATRAYFIIFNFSLKLKNNKTKRKKNKINISFFFVWTCRDLNPD